ncbi:MAG: hydroxymethylbilane synthase [Bradymonadaceae bacterium]
MKIKAGSRTSTLAMWQAERVADLFERAHPEADVEIVGMQTLGDRIRDKPVPEIGGKGLKYAGSPARGTPADAFVSHKWDALSELPDDGIVATGSRRRRAQLSRYFPDVQFENLRGNIGTRLEKLRDRGWDGIIMAATALERLDKEELITERLDPTDFVPATGQGAIGIEVKEDRGDIQTMLADIWDTETVEACTAERIFMRRLEGGCSVPLGGYCRRENGTWAFYGWVGNQSGDRVLHERKSGNDPNRLAHQMSDEFIDRGADEILEEWR